MKQGYEGVLIASQVDGAALANSAAQTSLLIGAAKWTMSAGFFDVIGTRLRLTASGRISNIVTTPGTFKFEAKIGTIVVAASQALALNIVAKTDVRWGLSWDWTVRAIGTAANIMHDGVFESESVIGSPLPSVGGSGRLGIPASAPAVGTSFDSTTAAVLDVFGTWSIANAANSIQVHQYMVECLN